MDQKLESLTQNISDSGGSMRFPTGSRGDVFVVRTSKLVENVWKMGYLDSLKFISLRADDN